MCVDEHVHSLVFPPLYHTNGINAFGLPTSTAHESGNFFDNNYFTGTSETECLPRQLHCEYLISTPPQYPQTTGQPFLFCCLEFLSAQRALYKINKVSGSEAKLLGHGIEQGCTDIPVLPVAQKSGGLFFPLT
jgi:hypothetical protein